MSEDPSTRDWREIMSKVHNHGPDEGPGLDCPEQRLVDGRLRGACIENPYRYTYPATDAGDVPAGTKFDHPYITKDSGQRVDYPSGMRRDVATGRPRFDLIPTFMLRRIAELYARGAEKYGDNNWQLADSEEELQRFKSSAWRHFVQWVDGERDEDHGAAVFFNIAAAEHVKRKLD